MKHMKRMFAMLLTVLMLVSVVPLGAVNVSAANYTKEQADTLRSKIVQYMYEMGTVKWIAGKQFNDGGVSGSFFKDKTYYGIPYQKSGKVNNASLGKFKDLLKKNDNKIYEIPGHNDCSTAIALAYKAYISDFPFTTSSPMYFRPGTHNFTTVGNYQLKWEKGDTAKTCGARTCSKNGKTTMFSSYSVMQSGDVLIGGSGHIMLVVSVNTAKKTAKVTHQMGYYAKYDPSTDTSVAIDEKKVGGQAKARELKNTTWGINQTKSFQALFDGNYFPARYKPLDVGAANVLPTVTLRSTTDITASSAMVHMTVSNPSRLLITARGTQIRKKDASAWEKTFSEDLSKKTYNRDPEITGAFTFGSGKEVNYALSSGTIYEYRCFCTYNGKIYYSSISTFTTIPGGYTFNFNSNGGTGSMNQMTVKKNQDFTLPVNKFTKKGSIFQGWNVKRNSDGKFFVSEKGWLSTSEISAQKVSKKLYANQGKYNFSASWQYGSKENDSFTFYAVWKACSAHKWDGGKVTKAATTTATGTKTYTCTLCGQTRTETIPKTAATNPTVSLRATTDITTSSAMVHMTVSNPSKLLITARGTQIRKPGETEWAKTFTEDLSKKDYNKDKSITGAFTFGDGKEVDYVLSDGTKYEFRCFCTYNGQNYYSNVSTFTTKKATTSAVKMPSVTLRATTDITTSSAMVHMTVSNPSKLLITARGTQIRKPGETEWAKTFTEDLSKKDYNKDKSITGAFTYGSGKEVDYTLSPGMTYEYRCFCTYNGNNYYSKTSSFKTTDTSSYKYTVKYNANGGKGTMAAMSVMKDTDFTLPENQFTKAGYTFAGWTVKRSSDSKWYVPNEGWKTTKEINDNGWSKKVYESGNEYRFNAGWINGTKTSDTYTFYAVWETCKHEWDEPLCIKEPTTTTTGQLLYTCIDCGKTKTETIPKLSAYQIKFNANGGKGTMAAMSVTKDTDFTLPENQFTKTGYTFTGWTVKRTSDSKWYVPNEGWKTIKEINDNSWGKKIYESGVEYRFNAGWINGTKASDTYTFYAVWEKDI